jgi:hypothetical protein
VIFQKAIWLKRLSAIFLLLVLSAVTIVQVSHSHNAQQLSAVKAKYALHKNGLTNYHQPAAESKCFICEYQLAKDVDASYFVFSPGANIQHPVKTFIPYLFFATATYNFFESRGPPQLS